MHPTPLARLAALLVPATLAACTDKTEPADSASPAADDGTDGGYGDDGGDGSDGVTGGEITLETRDGLDLVADYYPAEAAGRPGIILLHMIPPTWDRSSWPADFISALQGLDASVLVLDRRGAGESEGVAREAYEGEKGRYDVEAAALRLAGDGAGPLLIIGASNGTTSMIDYAVWAPGEGLPAPVGLGFMTGGDYTENQVDMAEVGALGTPAFFTFSTAERAWSVLQQDRNVDGWNFFEYAGGDHGTLMFTAAPEVSDDIVSTLSSWLE